MGGSQKTRFLVLTGATQKTTDHGVTVVDSYAPDPNDPENHGDFIARKFLPVDEDDSSRIHVEEVAALHDHKSEIIAAIPADASDWDDRDAKLIINYSCGIEGPMNFLEHI